MTPTLPTPVALITLQEANVAKLASLLSSEDDTLDAVVGRCIEATLSNRPQVKVSRAVNLERPSETALTEAETSKTRSTIITHSKAIEVFGERISASSMGKMFRDVVDLIHDLDPQVIQRLSLVKARVRRYVASCPEDIHGGRMNLPTLQTESGWWVSGNIGAEDLKRALRALCEAGGLTYGDDIRYIP